MIKNWSNHKYSNGDDSGEEPQIISIEKPSFDIPIANKIYFYNDVNKTSILNLNRQIDELTKQMKIIELTYNLTSAPVIEIHIHSDGGDIFAAMTTVDKILNSKIPIYTYCEGIVASAATLISCVGHQRFISKHSCMLIHQLSSECWGNFNQFKDEMKNMELLMTLMKSVYKENTLFNDKELDNLLARDLYLNSEECLKYDLVDKVL